MSERINVTTDFWMICPIQQVALVNALSHDRSLRQDYRLKAPYKQLLLLVHMRRLLAASHILSRHGIRRADRTRQVAHIVLRQPLQFKVSRTRHHKLKHHMVKSQALRHRVSILHLRRVPTARHQEEYLRKRHIKALLILTVSMDLQLPKIPRLPTVTLPALHHRRHMSNNR
jgi:hypothetical protein